MPQSYLLFVMGSLGLLALVVVGALRTAQLLRHWRPDRNLLLLPAENLLRGVLVLCAIGLGLLSGLPPERLGWRSLDLVGDILWGVGIGGFLAVVIYLGTQWAVRRWGDHLYDAFIVRNITPRSASEWPLLLGALLLAVTTEELLFRSLLLGGLSPPLPFWPLAFVLAICFGVVHLPQGRLAVAVTTLAGLLFAWLFLTRRSLWASLVAHYVANGLQLWISYRQQQETSIAMGEDGPCK
ncbi:MAG TPA: CPBP family intramembrane metalloprotease [Caldilineae bacterium]|nr:CPBP family intramembrane metalloprotease [Caldilineae bacterium]